MRKTRTLLAGVALCMASVAFALDVVADIPPPDLPVATLDLRDIEPVHLEIPAAPAIDVIIEKGEVTASLSVETRAPEMAASGASAEAESTPPVGLAPLAAPAATEILPPDLPAVVVDVAAGGTRPVRDLSPEIGARSAAILASTRLPDTERKVIARFYEERGNAPLWIGHDGWNPAARGIVARLGQAGDDGLNLADYVVPAFEANDAAGLAEADLRLTALAVQYARDARGARIDPRRLSRLITPSLTLPAAEDILSHLANAGDGAATDAFLAAFNPPHAGYQALRRKLAEIRAGQPADAPIVAIPQGPALKLGMRDQRVPLVRARLGLGPAQEPVFDRTVAVALADFQKTAGLPANGILSPRTLAALGAPATSRLEADIVAQMERWRWLPPDLGPDYIMVNVPEYTARLIKNGAQVHQTRTIVGKPQSPTPIFSDRMDHLIVNPSWFVPPSIMKNEFLPKLAVDPDYAKRRGFEVIRRGNTIQVRQPPGERNALGHIKFMFPNDHAVYLHDTPARALFSSSSRAFSHGCVRVEQPFKLAEFILGRENGYPESRVRGMVGSGERMIKLPKQLPIHLTYMTHVVDEAGVLTTFDDIYGFHALVRNALAHASRLPN